MFYSGDEYADDDCTSDPYDEAVHSTDDESVDQPDDDERRA